MLLQDRADRNLNIFLADEYLSEADTFCYLIFYISLGGQIRDELSSRLQFKASVMSMCRPVIGQRPSLHRNTKGGPAIPTSKMEKNTRRISVFEYWCPMIIVKMC